MAEEDPFKSKPKMAMEDEVDPFASKPKMAQEDVQMVEV